MKHAEAVRQAVEALRGYGSLQQHLRTVRDRAGDFAREVQGILV